MAIKNLLLTVLILLSNPVLGTIVMTSDKPVHFYTEDVGLVVEYSDDADLKPFVALTGPCIGHVKIYHDNSLWLNDLGVTGSVDTVKEVVLISPTGDYIELVAEFFPDGFRALKIEDLNASVFIDNLIGQKYFIMGIVKHRAIIEIRVFPLVTDGTKTFLNDCSF